MRSARSAARHVAWAVAALLAGCGPVGERADIPKAAPAPPAPAARLGEKPVKTPAPSAEGSSPAKAVTVRVVDGKEFAEALRQYRGKPVLVDYWATWCTSCVKRFPHTVELGKQFADRGLVTVSVSFDDPDDEPAVLKFLKSQGADFDNFLSRHGGGTQSFDSFGLEEGTLPRLELYDRQGKRHKAFVGEKFKDKEVEEAVKQLLDSKA